MVSLHLGRTERGRTYSHEQIRPLAALVGLEYRVPRTYPKTSKASERRKSLVSLGEIVRPSDVSCMGSLHGSPDHTVRSLETVKGARSAIAVRPWEGRTPWTALPAAARVGQSGASKAIRVSASSEMTAARARSRPRTRSRIRGEAGYVDRKAVGGPRQPGVPSLHHS